ncbi:MAG: GAF domain-containing protein [Anaerolineales bacterium]|nr:GAF domain-containing protein [Anaerolineales bacterium]
MPGTLSEAQLRLKARQLDLILSIDRLRDNLGDERELAAAIVACLTGALDAQLCWLCLRDDDTGQLQLRALTDRVGLNGSGAAAEALLSLAQQAAGQTGAEFVQADVVLGPGRPAHGLAAPLRVGGASLGALLLLNVDRPFSAVELALVEGAISQIDSALQHARTLRELRRRQLELETIFRIDRLRDHLPELQPLLEAVLAEVCAALEAEASFLMLHDQAGHELSLRAQSGRDLFEADSVARLLFGLAEEALRTAELVSRASLAEPVQAVAVAPLILRDRLIGVLGVAGPRGRPAFQRSDRQLLRGIASQMDTAIFENLQNQRLRSAFGQCVGPQVMERLLSIADHDLLSGERRLVTTLFSDIRGFTQMSERNPPEMLQAVLNDHLSALTDLVLAHEGTLDKYVGDSVMCFFNAPEAQPDHALRAVRLALEMQAAHRRVIDRWSGRLSLPPIGIGISTGETMMGNFGSLRRLEYTAIGRDVNLAARLCAAAEGDQILISSATYALVQPAVVADPLPGLRLKGIDGDVASWQVRGLQ